MRSHLEPTPPEDRAALLVRGPGVSEEVLELLRVELEALLEDVDRGLRGGSDVAIEWNVRVDSAGRQRVLADPAAGSQRERAVTRVLGRITQGIESLRGKAWRPPGFPDEALFHLGRIVAVIEKPGVTGIAYYANRRTVRAGSAVLQNLRSLSDGF